MPTCHLYIFVGKVSVQLFFNWLVSVAVAFLEFFIYSRNKSIFRNMIHRHFSWSVTCLFILLGVSFTEQIFKILIKSSRLFFFLSRITCLVSYTETH